MRTNFHRGLNQRGLVVVQSVPVKTLVGWDTTFVLGVVESVEVSPPARLVPPPRPLVDIPAVEEELVLVPVGSGEPFTLALLQRVTWEVNVRSGRLLILLNKLILFYSIKNTLSYFYWLITCFLCFKFWFRLSIYFVTLLQSTKKI